MMIDILFENDDLVVCVKPVGIPSQNDRAEDMVKILAEQSKSGIYPVHRLDTAVGGTMVFAKNSKTAASLSKQITDGNFRKHYIAAVCGKPEEKHGVLEDLLFKDSAKNKSYVVKRLRKGVKKAVLEYDVLAERDDMSLVSVLLHTGRSHQIRVQFASRKMPLVGDGKYGSRDNRCTVALWSSKISFLYNSAEMAFESEPDKQKFPWVLF
ncbi:MAG: RNA pseudouridine synthase [Clostridia bacterium]|nr:RNA pseudouridine synthase [Clostridia bacterium]